MSRSSRLPLKSSAALKPVPSKTISDDPVALGKSESTRLLIIRTAEKLFGDFGIDGVGLRTICEAANQKNNNAVQYHFGDKIGLLTAILEMREGEMQPLRQAMLEAGERQGRLKDVRYLLRVCFEPNYLMYRDRHDINFIKLHAAYVTTHRPRGIPHPVDTDTPNAVALRHGIRLLGERLAYLGERRYWLRLESAGEMFLSALIQHSVRKEELNMPLEELYEDAIEMMAAALSAPPSR
jgi:AcrR family transcriptional regulator